MKKLLIIGGGPGGTMVANGLANRGFDVTVFAASADHMFQPALLYVAFEHATPHLARRERGLLKRRVRLVQEAVTHIDLAKRVVTTKSGGLHGYDVIVIATGVHADPGQIAGLAEVNARFGDYHSSVSQAQKLAAAIDAFTGGTIALGQSTPICVCPPSPVEGILLTDRLLRERGLRDKSRLVYFTPYPRAYPAEPMNQIVEPEMKARGIEIMPFFDVDRIDPATRTIHAIEGETITYDLPIIVPPFKGSDIAYEPATVVDESRFLITDKATLRVKGVEAAYAICDGTDVPTAKSGVAVHLEAQVVIRELRGLPAVFDGRTNCPLDLGNGKGTFVIGSFTEPVVKYLPTRIKHFMKMMMARIYWMTLSGLLEPIFRAYFAYTAPKRLAARLAR